MRPRGAAPRWTNLPVVDDFPAKIAGLLETWTEKIRAMTVDRAAKVLTYMALGLVALTLVSMALLFVFVGLFRILGEVTHKVCDCTSYMEITYAIIGGLFLLFGALLWSKRIAKEPETGAEQES